MPDPKASLSTVHMHIARLENMLMRTAVDDVEAKVFLRERLAALCVREEKLERVVYGVSFSA